MHPWSGNNDNNNITNLYTGLSASTLDSLLLIYSVLVPSELLLSTHLPTLEGWATEYTVGLP